jgi:hypothetical protein
VSTGVFRPYPPPQQPAVRFTPGQIGLVLQAVSQLAAANLRAGVAPQVWPEQFTPGQPLGSPIGQATASLAAYVRASVSPALPALGIAVLIPVAAAFVPPAGMARVPTVQPAMVRLQAPGVAAFLSPNTTDAPIAGPPVLGGYARPAYPVQELEPGVAPLIPVTAVNVPPSTIARSPVMAYPTQQPDQGGAWLTAVPTDYLLPSPTQQPARVAYPVQQPLLQGAWLAATPSDFVLASPRLDMPRATVTPLQMSIAGPAPLLTVASYIPPAPVLGAAYRRSSAPLSLEPSKRPQGLVAAAPIPFTPVAGTLYRAIYPTQPVVNYGGALFQAGLYGRIIVKVHGHRDVELSASRGVKAPGYRRSRLH